MNRLKIDYGIDLGTTNSSICRMENGTPVMQRIEVTDETMPSCVWFNKRKSTIVGAAAYRSMKSDKKRSTLHWKSSDSNTFLEFKRTMGTDTLYHSSNMDQDFTSEQLSAEVLKALKSYITDETVNAAVITVPAKFTVNQKTATMNAARMAGITDCHLLQEPIAAAYAYGLRVKDAKGFWMVFDLGGGTFDAALLQAEDGIIRVFDTEGDNYLGGKNLDYAIVDNILIPHLRKNFDIEELLQDEARHSVLRDAMKTYAEDIKNALSFKTECDVLSDIGELGTDSAGEDLELDIHLSREAVFSVMRPYVQKAVDICLRLLGRNNLKGEQLERVILVGGPTYSPLVRTMLTEQISHNIDTTINPMTAVSVGAAIYASTLEAKPTEADAEEGETLTVQLQLNYESTSVETSEWLSARILSAPVALGKRIWVEFERSDGSWSSGRVEIDDIGNVVELPLQPNSSNLFYLKGFETFGSPISVTPKGVSILQGAKVAQPPLPYNIGISVWDNSVSRAVFQPVMGLEKNRSLPASGILCDYRTGRQLRPGVKDDVLKIPIYQADEFRVQASSSLYEYVADVIVTGEDINVLIEEDSLAEVTLNVDSSEMMTMEVYFPRQEVSVYKQLDTSRHQSIQESADRVASELNLARLYVEQLKHDGVNVSKLEATLNSVQLESESSSEKKAVLQHLKEVMRQIETEFTKNDFNREVKDTREWLMQLQRHQRQLGNETSAIDVSRLAHDMNVAIAEKDSSQLQIIRRQIINLDYDLARNEINSSSIKYRYFNFEQRKWGNKEAARAAIDQAMEKIKKHEFDSEFQMLVNQVLQLDFTDYEERTEMAKKPKDSSLLHH